MPYFDSTIKRTNAMSTAYINQLGNVVFLNFFNSKEVYSIKGFDTVRKAKNYTNKYGIVLVDSMPEHIKDFQYND